MLNASPAGVLSAAELRESRYHEHALWDFAHESAPGSFTFLL